MDNDTKDGIAGAIAVALIVLMIILSFEKPESAIALSLLAIAVFKGMEKA